MSESALSDYGCLDGPVRSVSNEGSPSVHIAPRWRKTTAASIVAVVASTFVVSSMPAHAAPELTQAVIASTGACGNAITMTAMDKAGRSVSTGTLVRGRPGIQLISYRVTSKPYRLLYGAYNCSAKTFKLYTQRLDRTARTSLLWAGDASTWLVDASWNVKDNVPVILTRDPNFTFTLALGGYGGFTPIWSQSSRTGGLYLTGIDGRTGGETVVYGSDLAGTWAVLRVAENGQGGVQLTGPGEIRDVTSSILGQADAFATTSGTWVCDSLTSGKIQDATNRGDCVQVDTDEATSAVFAWASGADSYWLGMSAAFGPNMRVKVSCPTGDMFSCGRPEADSPTTAGAWRGQNLVWTDLYSIRWSSLRTGRVPA